MQVTNKSAVARHYAVNGKIEGLAPGESREIAGLTEDNPSLAADLHAELVETGKAAAKAAAAPHKPAS